MKPAPFDYLAPSSLDEALVARSEHAGDCAVLAGGQSLVPALNLRLARPAVVIDINGIAELGGLGEREHVLAVGATVRQRTLERDPAAVHGWPLLVEALSFVAHPPIRTRGTVCGSLAHADPAAELPAAASVLDAEIVLARQGGERRLSVDEFFTGWLTTAVEPDELVVEALFPALPAGAGTAFVEVGRRHGDFALVGVAAVLTIRDGIVDDLRLALSGVDGVPARFRELELSARGAPAGAGTYRALAADVAAALDPQDDLHASAAYRRRLAAVLVEQALESAAERSG